MTDHDALSFVTHTRIRARAHMVLYGKCVTVRHATWSRLASPTSRAACKRPHHNRRLGPNSRVTIPAVVTRDGASGLTGHQNGTLKFSHG
jgi:hypothetical protein